MGSLRVNTKIHVDLRLSMCILQTKRASAVRPGSVSVTESSLISRQKNDPSHLFHGEPLFLTSDTEWKWWVWDNSSYTALGRDANPCDGIIIPTSAHHTVGRHECRMCFSLWQLGFLFFWGRDSSLLKLYWMFWWINRKTVFKKPTLTADTLPPT